MKSSLNMLTDEEIENEIKSARATEEFLKLAGTWEDDRTADEIIADIKNFGEVADRKIEDFDS